MSRFAGLLHSSNEEAAGDRRSLYRLYSSFVGAVAMMEVYSDALHTSPPTSRCRGLSTTLMQHSARGLRWMAVRVIRGAVEATASCFTVMTAVSLVEGLLTSDTGHSPHWHVGTVSAEARIAPPTSGRTSGRTSDSTSGAGSDTCECGKWESETVGAAVDVFKSPAAALSRAEDTTGSTEPTMHVAVAEDVRLLGLRSS